MRISDTFYIPNPEMSPDNMQSITILLLECQNDLLRRRGFTLGVEKQRSMLCIRLRTELWTEPIGVGIVAQRVGPELIQSGMR